MARICQEDEISICASVESCQYSRVWREMCYKYSIKARGNDYGVQMGMDHVGRTTDSLWKCIVPYPEGSWVHEEGRKGGGLAGS